MLVNEGLNKRQSETLPFPIGETVQLSHGLYGADVGIVLTYDNKDFANPHLITHVTVGGVINFYPTSHRILPEEEYLTWPIGRVKRASNNYKEKFNKLKK